MILIISSEDDQSTNDVIDWLNYLGASFIRVSDKTPIEVLEVSISSDGVCYRLMIDGHCLKSSELSGVWYRRGALILVGFDWTVPDVFQDIRDRIQAQVRQDIRTTNEFISAQQSDIGVNSELRCDVNKLEVLAIAAEIGMAVPETLVTGSKDELLKFCSKHALIASKNMTPGYNISNDAFLLVGGTVQLSMNDVREFPQKFAPSLFQEYVKKWIELRIFFLNESYFASAIFSQFDEMTRIDFRNYNAKKPNRTPPFRLPKYVRDDLIRLMKRLRLNSGSIDMLVTPDMRYVFLEVNPVGQFWQVSHPCNYGIEREIAQTLMR